jgi:electron transport complex protein RnfD
VLALVLPGPKHNLLPYLLYHAFGGGLMLGALFMATDYVTSPIMAKGRWIFGVGCGVLTVLIRLWGGYPEGVSYSILLMNVATPVIDRFTRPRLFGRLRKTPEKK